VKLKKPYRLSNPKRMLSTDPHLKAGDDPRLSESEQAHNLICEIAGDGYGGMMVTLDQKQCNQVAGYLFTLEKWVRDLQSGMYINCVYCGHRYGPKEETPDSMADVLKAHIKKCPKHPLSEMEAQRAEAARLAWQLVESLKYDSPPMEEIKSAARKIEKALSPK
jgi:DNA-directed RNA polymerase subunit RPC12/RpoP